jgi:integrase
MEIKVSIYERVKEPGKPWGAYGGGAELAEDLRRKAWLPRWCEIPVRIPRARKDGSLFAKDNRQGRFIISWCENRRKKRQAVRDSDGGNITRLSDAVALAKSKAWYLNSRKVHPVADPTVAAKHLTIPEQAELYLAAKSGCKATVGAHRLALREFQSFAARQRIAFVDEIAKPHMRKFFDELVGGGNCPFTAGNKVLRVNSFYRAILGLDPGKGVITKKDFKRELTPSRIPEIYSKAEIEALFKAMDGYENLLFSVLLQAGLRRKELMHLEDGDLMQEELAPGKWKSELRIESKPRWGHMTKTGEARTVLIPKALMDRLQGRKATPRPSSLLFGAGTGKPDWHILDRLKSIAGRAGIDPSKATLHRFRATCATDWLRSKDLGGRGFDIGFVRQQLGHRDLQSIEHYLALVKLESVSME